MSALAMQKSPQQPFNHWSMGDEPGVLGDIYQANFNLVCWQRSLSAEIRGYAEFLSNHEYFTGKSSVLPWEEVHDWLSDVLPAHEQRQAFIDDVTGLADMFSCLFELPRLGVRLHALKQPMCPRFHVDHVPCRLVTTYLGANTEWLPDAVVDRTLLGARSIELPDESSGLICSVPENSVALLKGEGWWENEGAGIVHRSPAASATSPRIFLSFDFAD